MTNIVENVVVICTICICECCFFLHW